VNVNDRCPVTELQVTACVFGSTYASHLIAEDLTVCTFSGCLLERLRPTVLPLQDFEVTHSIFDDVANTAGRYFSPLSAKR